MKNLVICSVVSIIIYVILTSIDIDINIYDDQLWESIKETIVCAICITISHGTGLLHHYNYNDPNNQIERRLSNVILNDRIKAFDDMDIDEILDDYIYSLNNPKIAKLIRTKLLQCNNQICVIYQRNYRDRCMSRRGQLYDQNDPEYIAKCQIMDKIHCYYLHILQNGTQIGTESKYNQLYFSDENQQNNLIFGYEFLYKDELSMSGIKIESKYKSLKEELTQNEISTISINQFNNEYQKCMIHHRSNYKRQFYDEIGIMNMLSLMIYCNFDELQRKFSKTYRECFAVLKSLKGASHRNFYHLAKLLKESVLIYGTSIKDGPINAFYHGIDQQLIPPQIVGNMGRGVQIFTPLSTSSSQAVAAVFSKTQGVIMTFGDSYSLAKYFSVSWLSDFGNESEYFFIQNRNEIKITNIIDTLLGYEYDIILFALKTYFYEDSFIQINKEKIPMILTLLQHQLYVERIDKLSPYGQKILNIYFGNKEDLHIHYDILQIYYPKLFTLFCESDWEWIKIVNLCRLYLCRLFPNVKILVIKYVNLNCKLLDMVLMKKQIFYGEKENWCLEKILIKINIMHHMKQTNWEYNQSDVMMRLY